MGEAVSKDFLPPDNSEYFDLINKKMGKKCQSSKERGGRREIKPTENIKVKKEDKNENQDNSGHTEKEEKKKIKKALIKNFVIQSMSEDLLEVLISELVYFKYKKNQIPIQHYNQKAYITHHRIQ